MFAFLRLDLPFATCAAMIRHEARVDAGFAGRARPCGMVEPTARRGERSSKFGLHHAGGATGGTDQSGPHALTQGPGSGFLPELFPGVWVLFFRVGV